MTLEAIQTNIEMAELLPLIEESLRYGGEIKFTPHGVSMRPLLRPNGDQVVLVQPNRPLKKNDIILYRRKNGQFVLHRIVDVKNENEFVLCGDGQWTREYPIYQDQIIGLVRGFYRRQKYIDCSRSKVYHFYCLVWSLLFPFRRYIFLSERIVRKIVRLLLRKK